MARSFGRMAAALLMMLALAACGASESDERQAFITFLQTQVLPKPGAQVPRLDDATTELIGRYADHYRVITRFHKAMDESVARPMQNVIARGAPRSIEEAVARRTDIEAVRAGMGGLKASLDKALSDADAERAKLDLPGDLGRVYGAAYDKLVTGPGTVFREAFPVLDESLAAILSLAGVIEDNKAAIKVSGSTIEAEDPELRKKVQAALAVVAEKTQATAAVQQKFRIMVLGR